MKKVILLPCCFMVGCFSTPPISVPPAPIETPIPIPPITPEPEPEPEPDVEVPQVVSKMTPFVVTHCGFVFEQKVRIIIDEKYPVGGLMGWADGCKRQTIQGLNGVGTRVLQFEVDGILKDDFWVLQVID